MTLRAPPLRLVAAGLVLVSSLALEHALPAAFPKAPARFARRVGKYSSLTGLWSGAYRYPSGYAGADAVPFNARLEETGESFTGDIDEPNTYADPSAPRLFASVSGARTGLDVTFVKTMDGTGGASHAIHYAGTVDGEFMRIEGGWTTQGLSGTFLMERAGIEAEEAISRTASATG